MDAILVTGGAGYIGSHICMALSAEGYVPVVYDSLVNGHKEAVRWGPLECGDICDRHNLRHVIEKYQPVGVIHCAALAYVGESVHNPTLYYRNNVAGSLTLLDVMIRMGVLNIVFSSSCATYGIPPKAPITELMPQAPINPYGRSKLMVEQILKDFEIAYGLKWIALRYFNAAGAALEGNIGELHRPETHLIPLTLAAADGGDPLRIFGADYDTPDGTCIRDYIHVADLADAHVKALSAMQEGITPQSLNLGNGHGFSVREVVSVVERVTGTNVPVSLEPRRRGDAPILFADASMASDVLAWKPARPQLEDMVESAWSWRQNCTWA